MPRPEPEATLLNAPEVGAIRQLPRDVPVRMVVIERASDLPTTDLLRELAAEPGPLTIVLLPAPGLDAGARVSGRGGTEDAYVSWLLVAAARGSLGQVSVKEAQRLVRTEMFREALKATSGNRRAAARTLGVNRRYVLKMLRENPDLEHYVTEAP